MADVSIEEVRELTTAKIRVVALGEIRNAFKELWAKNGKAEDVVGTITEWHKAAQADHERLSASVEAKRKKP
jgi:hypothetical protein